jgi:hypothetical protein
VRPVPSGEAEANLQASARAVRKVPDLAGLTRVLSEWDEEEAAQADRELLQAAWRPRQKDSRPMFRRLKVRAQQHASPLAGAQVPQASQVPESWSAETVRHAEQGPQSAPAVDAAGSRGATEHSGQE